MSLIYTPYDYNRDDVLKVPFFLLLSCLFALKYVLLAMMSSLPKFNYLAQLTHADMYWSLLLTSIPALLVLLAMAQRHPQGRQWARRMWPHGRLLLLTALSADIALLIALSVAGLIKVGEYIFILIAINSMFLFYVWRAPRVRDVFCEFPAYKDKPNGR
jgi:hypothetical protein